MKKAIKIYNEIEEKFLIITLGIMVILVFSQVVLRMCGHSNSWSEELSRYIYIWESWIGLSFCQKFHGHIRITAVTAKLPPTGQKIMEIFVILCCAVFSAILAVIGFQMTGYLTELGTVTPYLRLPYWIIYLSLPIGCVAYVIRLLIDLFEIITGKILTDHSLTEEEVAL